MAYTSGTAANYLDLLAILRTMALANGWAELEWVDGKKLWLRGEGTEGLDEIYVGIEAYENTSADYYNWKLQGSWGWRSGRALDKQPKSSGEDGNNPYAYFWQYAIPYWLVVTPRRIILVAKVSTVYQIVHLGLINPPATPEQYPYPLLIGGCNNTAVQRWSSTNSQMFWAGLNAARLSMPGGIWMQEIAQSTLIEGFKCVSLLNPQIANIMPGLDGSYLLEPIMVVDNSQGGANGGTNSIFGEVDGLFRISGQGNAAESIVSVGGINYLVVQDVFRTNRGDYCALRLN